VLQKKLDKELIKMSDEALSLENEVSNNQLLHVNGLSGTTGEYLLPPQTRQAVTQVALGRQPDLNFQKELKNKVDGGQPSLGTKYGIDPADLSQAGWGIIFSHDAPDVLQAALRPLLDRRRVQTGPLYKEFKGSKGHYPHESKNDFLARFGAGPGPVNPQKIPYYLLIVGDPSTIPFDFQSQMDVQYAVGRIHFETLEEYACYARSVLLAEDKALVPRRAVFFGVQNYGDEATLGSTEDLIIPLAKSTEVWLQTAKDGTDWRVERILRDRASKAALKNLLVEEEAPGLLFTTSHGMGFPPDDPRQIDDQGSLVCSDWPGPKKWKEAIPKSFYFNAKDVTEEARLSGMISFHFACYGAGTPAQDEYAHWQGVPAPQIAPYPFVARLPQRMLSHAHGGALAVVAHVERTWSCSFQWPDAGPLIEAFESVLQSLLDGNPIGMALETFNQRYAEISTDLNKEIEDSNRGKDPDEELISFLWTANNDARSFVILGDPAVRLKGRNATSSEPRATIDMVCRHDS
jgi:hypothetical protein